MATQTVTEPPEEEMADAEERRRDDEGGKVMTYAQVLEDNKKRKLLLRYLYIYTLRVYIYVVYTIRVMKQEVLGRWF